MTASFPTPLRRGLPLLVLASLAGLFVFGPGPRTQSAALSLAGGLVVAAFVRREAERGRREDGWHILLDSLLVGLSAAILIAAGLHRFQPGGLTGGQGLLLALAFSAAASPWVAGCSRGAGAASRTLLWAGALFLLLPAGAAARLLLPPEVLPGPLLAATAAAGALVLGWRTLAGDYEAPLIVGSPAQQRRCRRARFGATNLLPGLAVLAAVAAGPDGPLPADSLLLLGPLAIVALARGIAVRPQLGAPPSAADRAADLAALGEYARLAAHEIRNSLSVLFSTTDLLRRDRDEEQRAELLDVLAEEGDRVRDVVDQLAAFSRGSDSTSWSLLRLRELARAAARRAVGQPGWPEGLRIELDLTDAADTVRADAEQLELALAHVLRAAAQGGASALRLATRVENGLRLFLVEGDGSVSEELVALMPSKLLSSATGPGSALGLAVAQRALREHGGELRLDRAEAGGLRARLELPPEARAPRRS